MNPAIRDYLQQVIRVEKARSGLTYAELSKELAKIGVKQSVTNLTTKISRGTLGAQLFIALMVAMKVGSVEMPEIAMKGRGTRR